MNVLERCPHDAPLTFTWTLRATGVITLSTNLFGVYLLLFKANKSSTYRYRLLYAQVFALLAEVLISLLSSPYLFFPMLGGINRNFLQDTYTSLGIDTHFALSLWIGIFSMQAPTIANCFCYRCQAAVRMGNAEVPKWKSRVIILLYHLFPVIVFSLMFFSRLSKDERRTVLERDGYYECLYLLDDPAFTLYDLSTSPVFTFLLVFVSVSLLLMLGSGIITGLNTMSLLNKFRDNMSPKTYRLQKMALISLCYQFGVPTVMYIIPIGVEFAVVFLDVNMLRWLANSSVLFFANQSFISTTCMIITTPMFCQFVLAPFNRFKSSVRVMGSKKISTASSKSVSAHLGHLEVRRPSRLH